MMRFNKIFLLHMSQSNYNDIQIQTIQEAHANNYSGFDHSLFEQHHCHS
jgi:hypothetical protein